MSRTSRDEAVGRDPFFVVGIAASAGSVPALIVLVPALPATLAAALLLAYHQDGAHPSRLVQLLQPKSKLEVRNAVDGEPLRPGVLLSAAPLCHIQVSDGWRVSTPEDSPTRFVRPSADRLFSSLAAVCGDRAVAVVLSGSGSDGARGVQAVKAAGGYVIVQNGASAPFPSMPDAAIRTGAVDRALPAEEIAAALQDLTRRSLN
jgi:two-component system chemotaxis response regulator CheB